MPVEFVHDASNAKDAYKLLMAYDGSGRRVSKTRMMKTAADGDWLVYHITHYTGIGTEVREAMRRSASPKTTVVVNLPEGLGRYMPDDAEKMGGTQIPVDENGNPVYVGEMTPEFEWYLKNHLGSTMLVYGTQPYNDKYSSYAGGVKAAYDYRAFGEQVSLAEPTDKVTENFTGKEKDDETELNYFGARYLDPMLGLWTSVDPARQFSSPYLYVGNGVNPVNGVDEGGNRIVSTNPADNARLADAFNSIASDNVRFYFDEKNHLQFTYLGENATKGSKIYSAILAQLAVVDDELFITIDPNDAVVAGGGHGMTLENGDVVLTGYGNTTTGYCNYGVVMQNMSEILMHEIVGHVAPMFSDIDITPNTDNAIINENIIRNEIGAPLRNENPQHLE